MEKTIKCPNCGADIRIDEAEYNQILSQVKNQEFAEAVAQREKELRSQMETQIHADKVESDAKVKGLEQQLQTLRQTQQAELDAALAKKNAEMSSVVAAKEVELANLKKQANDAVVKEQQKVAQQVADLTAEINRLTSEAKVKEKDAALHLAEQKESYEQQLRLKDEQVQQYKDFKAKLGTKLLGEDLEQHCLISYDTYVRPYLPNAEFGKDNDCSEGSKGDFIFREKEDGAEVMSIMFEMKNEADESKTKHKNADFFKKLDEDRKRKNCEYAVLVSMLEKDSELYNNGIVLAAGYEKMYVIRPQFFLPMLAILRQTGQNTLDCKRQLEKVRQQSVDVTNFEAKMSEFAKLFGKHCANAVKQREEAVKQLDAIITACNKAKEALRLEGVHYEDAEKNLEEKFTVRALTAGNPTMKQKFEEARNHNDN